MRTIKRYSNRKLYDTEEKRYITLDGIAELIRAGHDVEVIENDTGEDLTAVTLSQIIFEQQKRGSHAPLGFLTSLIRVDNGSPLELLRRSIFWPGSLFGTVEKELERRLLELVERGEMTTEQMRRLQSEWMARFHEGERRGRERTHERSEMPSSDLGLPSHRDIQELGQQIERLNERLDELIALSRKPRASGAGEPDTLAAERRRDGRNST